jgi:hypothetical protein
VDPSWDEYRRPRRAFWLALLIVPLWIVPGSLIRRGKVSGTVRSLSGGATLRSGGEKCQEPLGVFLEGRPCDRNVDSSPNRTAVCFCRDADPHGWPRRMHRCIASSSAGLIGVLTRDFQSGGRSIGQALRRGPVVWVWLASCCRKLPQRQSSACSTRPARSAFRSTERETVRKWSEKEKVAGTVRVTCPPFSLGIPVAR